MRLKRTLIVIAFTACGASVPPAHADSVQVFSGSIGGTSDFVFRGLSLTRGKPAAQASIDVEFPKEFYVGALRGHRRSESRAEPGPAKWTSGPAATGASRKISRAICACRSTPTPTIRGASATTAPNSPARSAFATSCSSRLSIHPTPRPSARPRATHEGNAWAVELSGRQPINERLSISAGFGHYGLEEIYHDSYNYWNVTLIATFKPVRTAARLPRSRRRRGRALRSRHGGRPRRGDCPVALLDHPIASREPDSRPALLMGSWSSKVGCRGTEER